MKKLLKWGGIVFVVIMILGAISSSKNSNTQQGSNTANSNNETTIEPTQAPTIIEANILGDAFDENQVAAEKEWKNKLVQFSAKITNITDSGLSFGSVSSKEFSLTQISCKIKDKDQLLPLKNEQTITVKGIVGDQTIGIINLSNCEVVE